MMIKRGKAKERQGTTHMASAPVLIPPHLIDRDTIDNAQLGEDGWTVPWAMRVDSQGRCWLDAAFPFHAQKAGTACLHLTRKEGGFAVNTRSTDHRWRPCDSMDAEREKGREFFPVISIV